MMTVVDVIDNGGERARMDDALARVDGRRRGRGARGREGSGGMARDVTDGIARDAPDIGRQRRWRDRDIRAGAMPVNGTADGANGRAAEEIRHRENRSSARSALEFLGRVGPVKFVAHDQNLVRPGNSSRRSLTAPALDHREQDGLADPLSPQGNHLIRTCSERPAFDRLTISDIVTADAVAGTSRTRKQRRAPTRRIATIDRCD